MNSIIQEGKCWWHPPPPHSSYIVWWIPSKQQNDTHTLSSLTTAATLTLRNYTYTQRLFITFNAATSLKYANYCEVTLIHSGILGNLDEEAIEWQMRALNDTFVYGSSDLYPTDWVGNVTSSPETDIYFILKKVTRTLQLEWYLWAYHYNILLPSLLHGCRLCQFWKMSSSWLTITYDPFIMGCRKGRQKESTMDKLDSFRTQITHLHDMT